MEPDILITAARILAGDGDPGLLDANLVEFLTDLDSLHPIKSRQTVALAIQTWIFVHRSTGHTVEPYHPKEIRDDLNN